MGYFDPTNLFDSLYGQNPAANGASGAGGINMPLMGLAQGLLQASGPSRMPVGFGQGLGIGLQGFQKGQEDEQAQTLKKLMLQVQMQKLQSAAAGGDKPSVLKTLDYVKSHPEDTDTIKWLLRGPTTMNLGGTYGVYDPTTGGLAANFQKTLPPEDQPAVKGAQAQASAFGKEQGDTAANLAAMEGSQPQLEDTVQKLSDLGKQATYTYTGQAYNAARRQLGLPATEGAQAREEYKNTVRDVLFPQLRQTFGAQFTAKEGEALIGTLGDPDKSPEEKDAALRAFIDQKRQTIQSKRRQVGASDFSTPPAASGPTVNYTPQGGAALKDALGVKPKDGVVDYRDYFK